MKRKLKFLACYIVLALGLGALFTNATGIKKSYTANQAGISNIAPKIIKIGIVPVMEYALNLEDYEICYAQDLQDATQFVHRGVIVKNSSCAKPTLQNLNVLQKRVSLKEVIYGTKVLKVDNVLYESTNSLQVTPNISGTQLFYPLTMVGDYFNSQLKKHPAINTKLGNNIKFESIVTAPVIYEGKYSNQNEFASFLEKAKVAGGIDKFKYDYIVMIRLPYNCRKYQNGVSVFTNGAQPNCYNNPNVKSVRSTVSDVNKSAYLDGFDINFMGNNVFHTITHELGHLMLGLEDTYSDSLMDVKYPEGVPFEDLSVKSNTVCLMSERLVDRNINPYLNKSGIWMAGSYPNLPNEINPFYLDDPMNYDLCPYDLELLGNGPHKGNKRYSTLAIVNKSEIVVKEGTEVDLGIVFKKNKIHPFDNNGEVEYDIYSRGLGSGTTKGTNYSFNDEKINLPRNTIYSKNYTQKLKVFKDNVVNTADRYIYIIFKKNGIGNYEKPNSGSIKIKIID